MWDLIVLIPDHCPSFLPNLAMFSIALPCLKLTFGSVCNYSQYKQFFFRLVLQNYRQIKRVLKRDHMVRLVTGILLTGQEWWYVTIIFVCTTWVVFSAIGK